MTERPRARIVPASDQSWLVSFGETPSETAGRRVLALLRALRSARLPGVVNLHPAYASLLVRFDPLRADAAAVADALRALLPAEDVAVQEDTARLVEVPVAYGGSDGPDLAEVASSTGLSEAEVVARHAGASYRVAFLGFTAGFPYLSGLPDALHVPRLAEPRRRVPGGSVAIAGAQAGIYPQPSPGGWRVIGRTPLDLFRPGRDPIVLLEPGDRVRFVRVIPRGEGR